MRLVRRTCGTRCTIPSVVPFLLLAFGVPATTVAAASQSEIDYGMYLSKAGNCTSCHTRENGEAFAGGVAFQTEFGTIYSTNITPDAETGIGEWTLDDFAAALRGGVRPDGTHVYPVFPYTSYTMASDAEVAALFAYFQSLPAVKYRPPENDLRFPYTKKFSRISRRRPGPDGQHLYRHNRRQVTELVRHEPHVGTKRAWLLVSGGHRFLPAVRGKFPGRCFRPHERGHRRRHHAPGRAGSSRDGGLPEEPRRQ